MQELKTRASKKVQISLPQNDNNSDISFFDVKELYDAAFAEKTKVRVNLKKFKKLMQQAEALDMAYRVQLANSHPYFFCKTA